MDFGYVVGREKSLFHEDISTNDKEILNHIKNSKCLVIGGAGSIVSAVVKELFKRDPKDLHVVDISENNLVELVRELRSTEGYNNGDFRTFAIDVGSDIFEAFLEGMGPYDYVFNLSALKHVRSEKDPYTLMRMIDVNVFNTLKSFHLTKDSAKKFFCVSTDKATNPVNMMGASKRIMELFLSSQQEKDIITTARFANVAFSDGSLLHGFTNRLRKFQPIAAPNDVRRYFVTFEEAGQLCLVSSLFGKNMEIFFPKLDESQDMLTFSEIAERFLKNFGYEPFICSSEEEARQRNAELIKKRKWACYFFESDTTGEKAFEEFFLTDSKIDLSKFKKIGIVDESLYFPKDELLDFEKFVNFAKEQKKWDKAQLLRHFHSLLPNFIHEEKGKNLDQKM